MANLQDIDSNLNSAFTGKIDIDHDLYAYIDESGVECFDFKKVGVSKWFNVSAFISKPNVVNQMVEYIDNYRQKRCIQKKIERMTAKELQHLQRKDLFIGLSRYNFITSHSLFYKPKIDPKDRLVTYPSMYFVGVKNVIERITWCTKQHVKRKTHVIISNRNNIKAQEIKDYLFDRAITKLYYPERLGIVKLCNIDQNYKLLLADYSAFSLRMALEESGDPPATEPYYFDWFQKGKLYSSNYGEYTGIWRNGLKLYPADKTLITKSDILDEGSHKL